ncbi:hypothetical protein [Amycolatopsis circi]|uniref:hypothetical protein n=1 Tax=Amycolatopsis circi TaxID=871959 RepID=UPI001ABF2BE8|nr:hypothetical protein [Amycolatopsis circi]
MVEAGTAGFHLASQSQDALEEYRPIFESRLALQRKLGQETVFPTLEDFAERSSALIGSPAQVTEKVLRYHEQCGHGVTHLSADRDGRTPSERRAALELFQAEVAPALRRAIPGPPWPSNSRAD